MIEPVTLYKCPETGKLFDTAKKAENSAKSHRAKVKREEKKKQQEQEDAKEKEFRRNYIRLNAVSPENAIELLLEKSEEFWGISLIVRRVCKVTYEKTYKYFSFGFLEIEGKIVDSALYEKYYKSNTRGYFYHGISDFLGFLQFETGSGNPGQFNEYPFRMDLRIPEEKFLVIKSNFDNVSRDRSKLSEFDKNREIARQSACRLSYYLPEYEKLSLLVNNLNSLIEHAHGKMGEIISYNSSQYVKLWESVNPAPQVNSDLLSLFENVDKRNY
jgi:hypothetical protein